MPVPSIDWFPLGASLNLNNSRNSNNPAITLNNDCPYVSWSEETSGATQLYVKHWATPTPTVTASPTVTPTSTASLTSTASPLHGVHHRQQHSFAHQHRDSNPDVHRDRQRHIDKHAHLHPNSQCNANPFPYDYGNPDPHGLRNL
jgi:hypothetical protein